MSSKQNRKQDVPEETPVPSPTSNEGADGEPSLFKEIRHPKKRAYVTALALTGNRTRAAELAGVERTTPYTRQWKEDEELQEAVRRAKEMAADRIEDELYRRGVEGVEKPTGWYKGKQGGYVKEYDTTAAIFLLKGLRPEKYADHQVAKTTRLNVNVDLKALPDQVIDKLANGADYYSTVAAWIAELREAGQPVPAGLLDSGEDGSG
jgi:hypothetical protein